MDWFLYANFLRHERVNYYAYKSRVFAEGILQVILAKKFLF